MTHRDGAAWLIAVSVLAFCVWATFAADDQRCVQAPKLVTEVQR